MFKLTQSLRHWLWENHRDIAALIMFEDLRDIFADEILADDDGVKENKNYAKDVQG